MLLWIIDKELMDLPGTKWTRIGDAIPSLVEAYNSPNSAFFVIFLRLMSIRVIANTAQISGAHETVIFPDFLRKKISGSFYGKIPLL